jgi:CxxC motif-containing protein (DUF1111 family)
MRATSSVVRGGASRLGWLGLLGTLGIGVFSIGGVSAETPSASKPDSVALGRAIFEREWMPNDPRSHGGDGLGPVYNDTSCVACHNAGGTGGGGPNSKNIDILSASRNGAVMIVTSPAPATNTPQDIPAQAAPKPTVAPGQDALIEFHAGFRTGRTVVLHKFGTDPNYESWRMNALGVAQGSAFPPGIAAPISIATPSPATTAVLEATAPAGITTTVTTTVLEATAPAGIDLALAQAPLPPTQVQLLASRNLLAPEPANEQLMQARAAMIIGNNGVPKGQFAVGPVVLSRSQRNPTALFGIGLIDTIPESAFVEAANRRFPDFPEVRGRVSHLKDGRVGRLGWKAQTAGTEDFVLTACAVEVGLEVPGHSQGILPQAPKYKATGMDLTADECASLVAFVRSLPAPLARKPAEAVEAAHLDGGKALFAKVGCATCHAEKLGDVEAIYSDLLLHDMGPELADSGSYDGSGSDEDTSEPLGPLADGLQRGGNFRQAARAPLGAMKQEWRTPPLWGFRDSGPYLHDGRAQTLDQAVAMHGGQGQRSAERFFKLSPKERLQVEAFLKSLVAPAQVVTASN